MAEKTKTKKTKKSSKKSETGTTLVSTNLHSKYRPRKLKDFVGQESQVKVIAGWFKSGRMPSTIMLEGLTGSGKTTLARIIGIYANCDTMDFCGKCPSCKIALQSSYRHPDVNEYNMGEVGGKADILNLVESSKFRPKFRKRIMLIDESHLITKAAESSMLVPTEEPPEDTIWIFCTSEANKVNQTLRNRCAQIKIESIEPDVMVPRLMKIVKAEGVKITDANKKNVKAACKLVAERSEGQMRFAISKLDNLISRAIGGEKFNKELVESDYAASGEAELDAQTVALLKAICANDLIGAIASLRTAGDARGMLHKTRYLITGVIGTLTKTNKWQAKPVKEFMSDKKVKVNLAQLIYAQNALIQSEIMMNSTVVPEAIVMETELGKLIAHDYFASNGRK